MNDKDRDEMLAMLDWYDWSKANHMLNVALVLLGVAIGVMFMTFLILAGV